MSRLPQTYWYTIPWSHLLWWPSKFQTANSWYPSKSTSSQNTSSAFFYSDPSKVIIDFDPVSPNSKAFSSHPNNANSWRLFCRQAMLSRITFGSGDSSRSQNQVNMNRRQSTIANLQPCDKWNWIAKRIMSSLYSCIFLSGSCERSISTPANTPVRMEKSTIVLWMLSSRHHKRCAWKEFNII